MGCLGCWDFLWDIISNCKHLSHVPESENRICALPDDLLLQILSFVPTKDAVATSILSKRWRCVWTMLPELKFHDESSETLGWFIEKTLQLHKAPKLRRLMVDLGPRCSVDVDVGSWVENAVNRRVVNLAFRLLWNVEPTRFPKSLYTCDTLVKLNLSDQILVDVSSTPSLPSLLHLTLLNVVYKDEDSFVRLLSISPVLKNLRVEREKRDNLKNVTVKVPSLKFLRYISWCFDNDHDDEDEDEGEDEVEVEEDEVEGEDEDEVEEDEDVDEVDEYEVDGEEADDLMGSLVIDSPALIDVQLIDYGEVCCLIENMPCLIVADIFSINNPDYECLRSLSSVVHLQLYLTKSMVACCKAIKFSQLIEFWFCPHKSVDWLQPLMFLLQNSPQLETLMIITEPGGLPLSWNQPSTIPGCLSSHLEIFGWRNYGGREDEKQLVRYILANSKCLKTVEIPLIATCNLEESQKELESMPRTSTSSQLTE